MRSLAPERRDDYYFFFAVLRTERLRAGAAFLVAFFARFLVDFFFIAITPEFVVVRGSAMRAATAFPLRPED
jgi:hypothetical protein